MDHNAKIYIAGHKGLVGSSLVDAFKAKGFHNIITQTHQELDLTDQAATLAFFKRDQPDCVVLAAAKVGGIWANSQYPADFIYQNLAIQNNVIHSAHTVGVKKLLFLGSSCIYPRECPQPIREEYLLTGPLEPTNRPYALAKIAGIEMCASYLRQYGSQFMAVMPTNLYGPGDNYDLQTSHVLPALIRKIHEAKQENRKTVEVWGTGNVLREFLYVQDLAEACVYLCQLNQRVEALFPSGELPILNIGWGKDITIRDLAESIKETVGFEGNFQFDTTKPDGTPRKVLNIDKIQNLGWTPQISLKRGLTLTYQAFKKSMNLQQVDVYEPN